MTETLVRDQVELKRQQLREADLTRIGGIETALAVLKTRFEAALERAVLGEDLKELKREMEAEMNKQIGHICDHFDSQTAQQSKDILHEVRGMFQQQQIANVNEMNTQRDAIAADQRHMRRQIFFAVFGSGLSVIAALVVFWVTK